ncbi:hypothetical protein F2Q70_00000767 [Brassica cretica]|uniref:Uncharacterized protein n=1 Tax=Brassica cretica TaxID=69181 RepID=A0A8S9IQ17_BRACR|nr:hypothetical protein F2Q70_00000767 [Brassica cretica]
MLLKGEVMGSRLTNNLIMELERTHNGGVGVGALQRCEPGAHGADKRSEQVEMLLPPLCLLRLSLVSPGNFTDLGCRLRLLRKHL